MGVICAMGRDQHEFWDALKQGTSAIGGLSLVDAAQLKFKKAAEVRGYDAAAAFAPKELAFLDRFAQFALTSAAEAVTQAGVEWTDDVRERGAIVTGSSLGGRRAEEDGYYELFHHNRTRVHPLTIPLSMSNAGASHISIQYGMQGPAYTVSTACSSAAHAIGQAFWMVRSGMGADGDCRGQ